MTQNRSYEIETSRFGAVRQAVGTRPLRHVGGIQFHGLRRGAAIGETELHLMMLNFEQTDETKGFSAEMAVQTEDKPGYALFRLDEQTGRAVILLTPGIAPDQGKQIAIKLATELAERGFEQAEPKGMTQGNLVTRKYDTYCVDTKRGTGWKLEIGQDAIQAASFDKDGGMLIGYRNDKKQQTIFTVSPQDVTQAFESGIMPKALLKSTGIVLPSRVVSFSRLIGSDTGRYGVVANCERSTTLVDIQRKDSGKLSLSVERHIKVETKGAAVQVVGLNHFEGDKKIGRQPINLAVLTVKDTKRQMVAGIPKQIAARAELKVEGFDHIQRWASNLYPKG